MCAEAAQARGVAYLPKPIGERMARERRSPRRRQERQMTARRRIKCDLQFGKDRQRQTLARFVLANVQEPIADVLRTEPDNVAAALDGAKQQFERESLPAFQAGEARGND